MSAPFGDFELKTPKLEHEIGLLEEKIQSNNNIRTEEGEQRSEYHTV